MKKENFKFHAAWYEAIRDLPKEIQSEILTAIMEYGLYGVEAVLKPTAKAVFMLVKQDMDREAQRSENGRKGGRKPAQPEAEAAPEPPKRAKPVARTLQGQAKGIFEEHYKKTFDADYYWSAKDAGAMAQLLKKLRYAWEVRGKPATDEQLIQTLRGFLEAIQDDWVHEHFSVTVINSKYNEIVTNIKAGKNGHSSTASGGKRGVNQVVFAELANDVALHAQGVADTIERPY